jgi:hypothetical protein
LFDLEERRYPFFLVGGGGEEAYHAYANSIMDYLF